MISSSKFQAPAVGSVVGTIATPKALTVAKRLKTGAVDFLELRLDAFAALGDGDRELARLERACAGLPAPLIVTARRPGEGGAGDLPAGRRRELLLRFLCRATLVDVELASLRSLVAVVDAAAERGVGLLCSHHDFRTTPSLGRLQKLAGSAFEAGATVFKVATMAQTPQALTTLLRLVTETPVKRGRGLAVMGMGSFGKLSRVTLGRAGSVLNYGYLDTAQVPGQWPAVLLKQRLLELA
jgi:3-dehydroquinate dehydratase-1